MLKVSHLERTYPAQPGGAAVQALKSVSLSVEQGDIFSLLGPSGCGKTTMLQCIAGLETPDAGRIVIGGETVYSRDERIHLPANERGLGMVFQSYAIWPHMSVAENVAFPLLQRGRNPGREQIARRVDDALAMVELAGYGNRSATQLSGGQQQRIALARALVHKPRLLLLDEPLSNLDAKLRDTMRIELRRLIKSIGITAIFVTHDQVEAMGMSDRVALMRAGKVIQVGTSKEIYLNPHSAFAADFMGSGNLVACTISDVDNDRAVTTTPFGQIQAKVAAGLRAGDDAILVIRPNAPIIHTQPVDAQGDLAQIPGNVSSVTFLGEKIEVRVCLSGGYDFVVTMNTFEAPVEGQKVYLTLPAERCIVVHKDHPVSSAARSVDLEGLAA
ncbi:ABC transporter ATP-binding protein [Microvirga puerhi]|uniref:ABC transporter ATP-binding protein n=1 Tax=Microvirga puerhi TaxID=2876078 RepID=A0ABS7VV65_9HYPH|nr:ABC transporter ATP-binding protein [Microvirga puerhi]MBZ6079074.1 ABC transporter ATP-binding protein [Microvirga puerhi]